MTSDIILEWDEEKRKRNIAERGIDFADAADVLADPMARKDLMLTAYLKVVKYEYVSLYVMRNIEL